MHELAANAAVVVVEECCSFEAAEAAFRPLWTSLSLLLILRCCTSSAAAADVVAVVAVGVAAAVGVVVARSAAAAMTIQEPRCDAVVRCVDMVAAADDDVGASASASEAPLAWRLGDQEGNFGCCSSCQGVVVAVAAAVADEVTCDSPSYLVVAHRACLDAEGASWMRAAFSCRLGARTCQGAFASVAAGPSSYLK